MNTGHFSGRHVLALLIGLVLMVVSNYGIGAMIRCCILTDSTAAGYVASGLKIVHEILFLLPAFVAGYLAGRRAILLGFVLGLIGGVVSVALTESELLQTSPWHTFTSLGGLVAALSSGITRGMTYAAVGGAAELIRLHAKAKR